MHKIAQKALYQYLGFVPRNRPFVFGIGLSKTGTTSLNDALNILGYRAEHLPPCAKIAADGTPVMDWVWWMSKFDAMTDLTVAAIFEELRDTFPNARFIYTPRDIDKWLDSCRRHFTLDLAEKRVQQRNFLQLELPLAFYGSFLYDEDLYRAAYERHDAKVRAAFAGADNFLEFDLTAGANWERLCDFLDKPVPDAAFPFSNKGRKNL